MAGKTSAAWVAVLFLALGSFAARKPNVVFVLTDDQDVMLGGMEPLVHTRRLLGDGGMTFTNFFVNTPVCCPSRAEIMSGRYGHNNLVNNASEPGCMHMNVTSPEFVANQLGAHMSRQGYTTGLFGKYMNTPACTCPKPQCKAPPGRDMPVPPGWDRWFGLCDPEKKYYNNTYNDDGTEIHFGTSPEDYMTSVIGNRSIAWLEKVARGDTPFFAYIAPHAPHISDTQYPYWTTPAAWHLSEFANRTAPRTPNFNYHNLGAHWLIRQQQELNDQTITWMDELFRMRWRSLLSVDELVRDVAHVLEQAGVLDNTYIMYTSDHGYNLGQQRLPSEKFNVYDNDIRVPMLIRGPGIAPGSTTDAVCGNVDLAPTIFEIAGGDPTSVGYDGRSMLPVLHAKDSGWRDQYLIEYWMLGNILRGCPTSPECNPSEGDCKDGCTCLYHLEDGPNNTYIGVRLINSTHNYLYAEFYEDKVQRDFSKYTPVHIEIYNVGADMWQMHNLYPDTLQAGSPLFRDLSGRLRSQYGCRGSQCL